MGKFLTVLLLVSSSFSFAQTISEIDSISKTFCGVLEETRDNKNDTTRLQSLYENQFGGYLKTIKPTNGKNVGQILYYRMQRNCMEFRELLDRLDPPKMGVKRVTEKPKSKASEEDLAAFKKTKKFYYYEVNGDVTKVKMAKGKWVDSFKDKTSSHLSYNWTSNCDFELVFIESNNEMRSNFSVSGDVFLYSVISKESNYYTLSVNIPGQLVFEEIKIYYK
jgi:hypothetical protein